MPPTAHIVLLRGVNVGGKNRLPTAALEHAGRAAGATTARGYIQSGNLVVTLPDEAVAGFEARLGDRLRADAGIDVPVLRFTPAELASARAQLPFPDATPATLHYAMLSARPDPSRVAALDPARSPGDRFVVIDRVVHLHLPNGVARTKLTNAWMDRALGVVSTLRNGACLDALVGRAGTA